jgi:hypothetical protein
MLQELLRLIADAIPIRFFIDELMKPIADAKLVVETVGRYREGFAAGRNFTQGRAALRTEATAVLVGRCWFVCNYGVCA